MGKKENAESWVWIHQFVDEFSDDAWAEWQQVARNLLGELEARGLNVLFRVGQSLDHIIFSTQEEHGLDGEPRVTLAIDRSEPKLRVAYGNGNLHFDTSQMEKVCTAADAVPTVLSYLKRLWMETKPNSPVPAELDV